jgi:hypothetical protein
MSDMTPQVLEQALSQPTSETDAWFSMFLAGLPMTATLPGAVWARLAMGKATPEDVVLLMKGLQPALVAARAVHDKALRAALLTVPANESVRH